LYQRIHYINISICISIYKNILSRRGSITNLLLDSGNVAVFAGFLERFTFCAKSSMTVQKSYSLQMGKNLKEDWVLFSATGNVISSNSHVSV